MPGAYVYIAPHTLESRYKIGWASDVENRLSTIGAEFDFPSVKCLCFGGTEEARSFERLMHKAMDRWRIVPDGAEPAYPALCRDPDGRTEWFSGDSLPRCMEFIRHCADLYEFQVTDFAKRSAKVIHASAKPTPARRLERSEANRVASEANLKTAAELVLRIKQIAQESRLVYLDGRLIGEHPEGQHERFMLLLGDLSRESGLRYGGGGGINTVVATMYSAPHFSVPLNLQYREGWDFFTAPMDLIRDCAPSIPGWDIEPSSDDLAFARRTGRLVDQDFQDFSIGDLWEASFAEEAA